MDFAKIEALGHLVHHSCDLMILEISYRSFVSMREVRRVVIAAVFDIKPYLFISIPERCSLEHKLVHFFYAKQVLVLIVVQQVLLYFHIAYHQVHHIYTTAYRDKCWKHIFLDYLKVAMVS